VRQFLFRFRGYTPVPFLLASLYWARGELSHLIIGGILCILGEMLRIGSLRHAGGATRTRSVGAPDLVSSGPYGHVRNPLYLANMMLYTGFAIASDALFPWLPLATVVFFTWQYGMIISLEEGTLRELFGPKYGEYCKRVPRLWPRLTSGGETRPAPLTVIEALRQERSTLMGLVISWVLLVIRLYPITIS
jgi:protein-S-isoprenylcysteine O-methyltransferase Ste14